MFIMHTYKYKLVGSYIIGMNTWDLFYFIAGSEY